MAWRLDEAVEHGMIDNTVEGTTTGKIWLIGRDEPLILSLNGDCWRDLAGTVLEFENPSPCESSEPLELDTEQTGIAGDITASRKARVPELSEEEMDECERQGREIPFKWSNTLYIEWFSEINGRVLIEAAGYELSVSEREWEMDEDQEEAQKLANLSAMRDFLTQVIRRAEPGDLPKRKTVDGRPGELNEFEWEERLKESDRLSEAYQEVLEKYMEDEDSERKEAFVMGWDGLLGAMADREDGIDPFGYDDEDDDDDDTGDDWQNDDSDESDFEDEMEEDELRLIGDHPLQKRSQEVAMRSMDIVNCGGGDDTAAQRLVSSLMQVSAKLAAVLYDRSDEYQPEAGFILAILKRCLGWVNEAIGASGELIAAADDEDHKAALEHLRTDAFAIRDGILELRRELKQS
ncbi:MAG: hypothetical protein NWT08_11410 [Akkermansiaceae bacterium]|jgi:hypothetical protein|nr:hypothetical protein [Akkermansiaceae bacterium]MDP4646115.1 hypothetical protein [Akkermansiaceae bacterium]MDP4720914.1 hypothetical protein [Akkermansiaceae bacterium]MDP4780727.1 hypothetical protein [Akkermansiaceae bacterium]MDP4845673.1 hypothetical protein [Akkermansiaceae bacterium]